MNKIIDWLLQPTPDGATYLQAIMVVTLLCAVLYAFYDTIVNSDNIEEEVEQNEKEDNI